MRCEVLTAVTMEVVIIRDVTPYIMVDCLPMFRRNLLSSPNLGPDTGCTDFLMVFLTEILR
jgi:hypothetical protein